MAGTSPSLSQRKRQLFFLKNSPISSGSLAAASKPLLQYRIVIFPDTDETGEAFKYWTQVAQEAQRLYKFRYPLRISPLLEQKATPEQKQQKIDLVDFLYPINNESNV